MIVAGGEAARPKASVLVADGDQGVAASLRRGLEAHGLSAAVVLNGREAASLARRGRFDLLLMNVSLPALDGLSIVRELREDGVTVPVVLLAAEDNFEQKITALRTGADDYLARPFHLAELMARIHARLREAWPAAYR
jgi:two-component system copper resistance phosphate regulon response regulator CusR